MSHENVQVVREQFEASNRREFARPIEDWADDVELLASEGVLAGTYSGREAVGEFFGDWFRTFGGGIHFDLHEVRDGGDGVAVWARHRATGRHSRIELVNDLFYEYRLRERKIVLIKFHATWDQALAAVGLSEQPMSQENVEVVRRSWEVVAEAANHGENPVARLFERRIFARECRFVPPQGIPGGKPFVGQEEISDWYRTWTEDFSDLRWSPTKVIDAGDGRVVAVVDESATGRGSGVAVERRDGYAYTLKGGKIVEVVVYLDPREALEAVGLSE